MGKINLVRVFLCGILTGGVAFLLQLILVHYVLKGTEVAAALEAAGRPLFPSMPFFLSLGIGIWTMWLYAAIRAHYGAGPKTAIVAGFGLWVIAVLVDLIWVSSRLTPLPLGSMLAPAAWSLPLTVVATLIGAWPYKA